MISSESPPWIEINLYLHSFKDTYIINTSNIWEQFCRLSGSNDTRRKLCSKRKKERIITVWSFQSHCPRGCGGAANSRGLAESLCCCWREILSLGYTHSVSPYTEHQAVTQELHKLNTFRRAHFKFSPLPKIQLRNI